MIPMESLWEKQTNNFQNFEEIRKTNGHNGQIVKHIQEGGNNTKYLY
jgi:hypothetical protein